MPLPTAVTSPNLVVLGPNSTSVITEIRPKNLTSRIPPFKVTQGHWNRYGSIGYV